MTAVLRPYGDTTDDGLVQASFSLRVDASERGRRAAVEIARQMGMARPQVVHAKAMGPGFTFFVVYGAVAHSVDPYALEVEERGFPLLAFEEVNRIIRATMQRRLVVIGASTGTDAHTVGLDAILSMKGYAGDHGLEYFSEMRVVNMGAQITPEEIVEAVRRERADALLISQTVTQRDAHIHHLREVVAALEAAGERDGLVLVGGGPRFAAEQATELGYDRIFGRGTKPSEVASYLVWAVCMQGRPA